MTEDEAVYAMARAAVALDITPLPWQWDFGVRILQGERVELFPVRKSGRTTLQLLLKHAAENHS